VNTSARVATWNIALKILTTAKMHLMSTLEFLQIIGRTSAAKHKSLVAIGERHAWKPEVTRKLLRGEASPTEKQLRIIAEELDLPIDMFERDTIFLR
jgi:hypothetical protein